MPITQESHWIETIHHWTTDDHNTKLINFLKNRSIKKYIDIGANVGGVCHVLLNSIPTLERCFLIEPDNMNYEYIRNKFSDNKKVESYKCGIFYTDMDYVPLYSGPDGNVGGYTYNRIDSSFRHVFDMRAMKLEDETFPFSSEKIDFIKIDVEGSEENIIRNSKFLAFVDYIAVEMHGHFMGTMTEIEQLELLNNYLPSHRIVYELSSPPTHIFMIKNEILL